MAKHWGVCQCLPCPSPSFSLESFPKSTKDRHPPYLFLVFLTWNLHAAFLAIVACLATQSFSIVKTGYIDSNDSNLEGCLGCQPEHAVLWTGCLPSISDPCHGDTRTNTATGTDSGVPAQGLQRNWLGKPGFCRHGWGNV